MTRKPQSIVKSVMHPLVSTGEASYDPVTNPGWAPFNQDVVPEKVGKAGLILSGTELANGLYHCANSDVSPCTSYLSERNPLIYDISRVEKRNHILIWTIRQNRSILYYQDYGGNFPAHAAVDISDGIFWRDGESGVEMRTISTVPALTNGKVLLGELDTAFLGAYTIGLFFSGYLADKLNLRYFLSIGMFGSGFCLICMALAYLMQIHSFTYFIILNIVAGLFQSTGWPSVVSIMASWFGEKRRGLIMGLWNAHTSVGNILGSVITAASVSEGLHGEDWPLGFAIPGIIMCIASFIVFLFIVPEPQAHQPSIECENELDAPLHGNQDHEDTSNHKDIIQSFDDFLSAFREALTIEGLVPFSLCLGFSKMCAYTLLYWGPYFLGHCGFKAYQAGYLCSFFDVGGVLGGISAGYLADRTQTHGFVAFVYLVVSIPVLWLYYTFSIPRTAAEPDVTLNIFLMIIVGFWVNAPYALVTTAVSANLGTSNQAEEGKHKRKILALVTGIIDGTGSVGAMMQGVVVGIISTKSWKSVFVFLMISELIAAVMLTFVVWREIKHKLF